RSVEFYNHDGGHGIEDRAVEVQVGAAVLRLHRDRRLVREAVRPRDGVLHRRDREWRPRLIEERDVQLAGLGGHAPLRLLVDEQIAADVLRALRARLAHLVAEWRRPGAVYGLAVHLQPAADGAQDVLADLRN